MNPQEHPWPGKKRWPVTARDRLTAIKLAKKRTWYAKCLNPTTPLAGVGTANEARRWWFITDEDPRDYMRKCDGGRL